MDNEQPLLELTGVTKEYNFSPTPTPVLKGIDLRVENGETTAIVGPSGTGKSSLLNIIGTLDVPTAGTVSFEGRDLTALNDVERARFRNRRIGFVFQQHHLLPQCTVLENVLVPTLVNKEADKAKERAVRLRERVGLAERVTHTPGQLSGGERQRVAVVRALINEPGLLLADEPTGSLNREGADTLAQLLLELNREEGMTLIVVTHSMTLAKTMGRVMELRDGLLTAGE